jgi:hypothetical protein
MKEGIIFDNCITTGGYGSAIFILICNGSENYWFNGVELVTETDDITVIFLTV